MIPSFPDVAVSSFISLGSRKEFSRSSFYMASFGRTLNDRRGLKTLEDPRPKRTWDTRGPRTLEDARP